MFGHAEKWNMQNLESDQEKEMHEISWNLEI